MVRLIIVIVLSILAFLQVPFTSIIPTEIMTLMSSPTPAPTATPTPTATPSPEPTPTPTLSPEEEKEILNQQFQDFLNKEGDFTEDKMSYFPMYPKEYDSVDKIDLGILRVFDVNIPRDFYVSTYGYFFGFVTTDKNDVILIMGFDEKNGNRFITPIEIVSSINDYYLNIGNEDFAAFWFLGESLRIDSNTSVDYKAHGSVELTNYLKSLKGKKIVLDIQTRGIPLNGKEEKIDKVWLDYLKESNEHTPYARSLIHRLATNHVDTRAVEFSSAKINIIDDMDDISLIDFDRIIFTDIIRYRREG